MRKARSYARDRMRSAGKLASRGDCEAALFNAAEAYAAAHVRYAVSDYDLAEGEDIQRSNRALHAIIRRCARSR